MPILSDKQALDFLSRLFPAGLKDPELLAEVCPEGWELSPLRQAFHPTPEQRHEEHLRWLRSPMHAVIQRSEGGKTETPPTFEEFIANEGSPSPHRLPSEDEWPELLGTCLWDILSDNHRLIARNGDRIGFGSFRAVSGLIDEFMEGEALSEDWGCGDCTRFYMGSCWIRGRTNLEPVYRLIFRRIKQLGYEWSYHFPRIYAFRFRKEPPEESEYNPSNAFAEGEQQRKEDEEDRKQQEAMARDLAKGKREALDQAPPSTVLAYQEVYGKDPHRWPPDPDSSEQQPATGQVTRTVPPAETQLNMHPEDPLIPISALQHWLYCPRQCALIHVEQAWSENQFTAEGRVMHERAHDGPDESRPGLRITRGMAVRSLKLGLTGQCDVVEFHADESIVPVEYKRGKPKAHRADEVQLCAQAMCLEEMLDTEIPAGCLYYGKNRRRKEIALDAELRQLVADTTTAIRECFTGGTTPSAEYESRRCDACSLIDHCQPKSLRFKRGAAAWFAERLKP